MNPLTPSSLENSLRQEAQEIREPFLPTLHARIQQQVHNRTMETPRFSFIRPFRIAAVILLAGTIAFVTLKREPARIAHNPPKPPALAQGDLKTLQGLVRSPAAPIAKLDQAVNTLALAGLDQDAQSFTRFLGRQLDAFPTPAR